MTKKTIITAIAIAAIAAGTVAGAAGYIAGKANPPYPVQCVYTDFFKGVETCTSFVMSDGTFFATAQARGEFPDIRNATVVRDGKTYPAVIAMFEDGTRYFYTNIAAECGHYGTYHEAAEICVEGTQTH